LSGLTAVIDAARMITSGDAEVVVAGGMESMSQAPHLLMGSRAGWKYGAVEALDHRAHDGLTDAQDGVSMGESTARPSPRVGVPRADQGRVGALSRQRAAAAAELLAEEIVPVSVPQRRGEPLEVTADAGIRPDTTAASLSRLRPAFAAGGTITAGNSSQISDGAAALVLTTSARADTEGWQVLARLGANGQTAGPDSSLQAQPADAIARALEK